MDSTAHILALIRRALDEFDDHPVQVSVRRAVRIASLIGDSHAAVRLGLDLQSRGGDPAQHRGDMQRLMADPSRWGDREGTSPDIKAMHEYMKDRAKGDGSDMVLAHSLADIEYLTEQLPSTGAAGLQADMALRQIEDRARLRTFSYLVAWERRFGYTSVNESIFGGYKAEVDEMLAEGVPDLVEKFTAVYRRMNEAAASTPDGPGAEELSQALTTCRRILEAAVDHVLPAQDEPSESGHKLDQPAYRNRLFEFIKQASSSKSVAKVTVALGKGLHERFTAVDELTNKGVHASVALQAANLCALNTYVLCGEILLLKKQIDSNAMHLDDTAVPESPDSGATVGDSTVTARA
ncbi:hypothetical protein ACIHCX_37950 [Streptomyces sp. NPDC052043]|uniref:hypothetical protein n=1 Tax=Streptomyces sp. NPDC052043 TaxID=3365684 RepID=UPI0037D3AA52